MTVRLLLHDHVHPVRRRFRALEYLLLFVGLAALDCYIWVNADAGLEQSYGNWSLDQQLQGHKPTFRGFVSDKLNLSWLGPTPEPGTVAVNQPSLPVRKPWESHLPEFALIGRIEVPRLGLDAIVREGVESSTLRKAVGHMPSTALPGQLGNAALAAHRDTLFRKLRDIKKNDRITMQTVNGTYDYLVESMTIVDPEDVGILKVAAGDRMLTLITCYPFNYVGSAPHRFIVKAREVEVSAKTQGSPDPRS